MNHDDQELARQVANGDRAAAEFLVSNHYESVLRLLTLLCRNEDLASDLAQDTFVRARLRASSYRGDSSLRLWIQAIAWREFLKSKRKRGPDSQLNSGTELSGSDEELSAEALDLWDAIGKLSEPLRAAFVLHEVTGWTTAETAKILKVPEGTVTARLFRAKQKLRETLGDSEWCCEAQEPLVQGM